MITNAILFVFQGFINILLLPLTAINIVIDFVASIPVVVSFLQIVVYVLPWSNILPLILLIIAIFTFRLVVSLLNFLLKFIPGLGG